MKKTIALLMVAAAGIAHADKPSLQGAWELGPYAGFNFLDGFNGLQPQNDDILGARLGYFFTDRVSVEGSYQRTFAASLDNLDSVRLNALYHLTSGTMFRPFLTVGAGWERTGIVNDKAQNDYGLNAGGGLKFVLANSVALRVDGRYNTVKVDGPIAGERQHNAEILAGLSWFFGAKAAAPVVVDSDNDGVNDKADKCPGTAAGIKVDASGCAADEDNDGVLNDSDKCPGTAAGIKVDASGCEVKVEAPKADADKDGVADESDKCPATVEGVKVDETGCPVDEDNDGVLNASDKCAKTPAGIKVDETGCPESVKKVRGAIKGINFKTGSALLLPSSLAVLNEAAKILAEVPDAKIEIQGHTDNTGKEATNMRLSSARAATVEKYLEKKGVNKTNITSKGYGSSVSVGDNATKAGRAENRRVEFKWVD